MSTEPDKRPFVSRLDRIAPLAFIAGSGALFAVLMIVLSLFGSSYP